MTARLFSTSPNLTTITLPGNVALHFSYAELVGIQVEDRLYVAQNCWGATTGKHLNLLDNGTAAAKAARLDEPAFRAAYEEVMGS